MDGEELYKLYVRKLAEIQNCDTDAWHELTQEERDTWNAVAEEVFPYYPDPTR
jgi:hypothetical protein